jgi:cell division protein FtsB
LERDKLIAQCVDITFRYGELASEVDESSALQADLAARLEAATARCAELASKIDELAAERDKLSARCAQLAAQADVTSPIDVPTPAERTAPSGDELSSIRAELMAERARSAGLSTQRRRLEVELNMALSESGHWRRRALTAEGQPSLPSAGAPSVSTALRKTLPPLRPPVLPVRPRGAVADKRRDAGAKGEQPTRQVVPSLSATLFDPIRQQARRVRTWLTAATIAVGLAARQLLDNFKLLARSAPVPALPKGVSATISRLPRAVSSAVARLVPVSKAQLPMDGPASQLPTVPQPEAAAFPKKEAEGKAVASAKEAAASKARMVAALQDVPTGALDNDPDTDTPISENAAANGNTRVSRLSNGLRERARRVGDQVQGRDPSED